MHVRMYSHTNQRTQNVSQHIIIGQSIASPTKHSVIQQEQGMDWGINLLNLPDAMLIGLLVKA